jgi:hypothetical protein
MTVDEMVNKLSYSEYLGWLEYFKARPVGWREDSRTSMIIRAFGVKVKPEDAFPSLKAISQYDGLEPEDRKTSTLKRSFMFQKMLSAKGGDKLEALHENSN